MRRPNLFAAVLSLFLLVPASITWAQTVTLTGVVYEPHTIKIPFNTPDGKITITLPDDIRPGETISGTVSMDPEGKNEKSRNEHLLRLRKHAISLDDGPPAKIEIETAGDQHITIDDSGKPIEITKSSRDLTLKNPEGIIVSKAEIPVIQNVVSGRGGSDPEPKEEVTFWGSINNPPIAVEKKTMMDNEPLVVFTNHSLAEIKSNGPASPPKWVLRSGKNEMAIRPICSTPTKSIFKIPQSVRGPCEIAAKNSHDEIIFVDQFNVLSLDASIGKSNLKSGEKTALKVDVAGLEDCRTPIDMTIVNQSTAIVLLDKGNHQTYHYDPVAQNNSTGMMNIRQGLTGVTPGTFNITANLILPTLAFGDIFQQQKSALKTTEDFNAWVAAIKKDLKAYADKQGNDEVGRAAKANAQRAIDNIPSCSDKNKLDECKAFADAYLRPVDIPRGAATMWVCCFEAYKAAIKAVTATLSGNPQLIDWEVIKNGIAFIRQMGEQLRDDGLSKGAEGVKKLVEGIQKAGETKENLEELKSKLDELNGKMNGKISLNEDQFRNYQLDYLIVSGYIHNLAPVSPTGITGPAPTPLSHSEDSARTREIIFDNYGREESSSRESKDYNPATYHVLLTNMLGTVLMKEGATVTEEVFNSAWEEEVKIIRARKSRAPFISELDFPAMGPHEKDKAAPINIKIMSEPTIAKPSSEKPNSISPSAGKNWMPSNFKVTMGDLPCSKISNINSFKITSKITQDRISENKTPNSVPGKVEYPNITFQVPASDIKSWEDWQKNYDLKKELKSGAIEYFDQSNHPLFSLSLQKTIPVSILPAANDFFTVIIKPGELDFDYNPLPPFLFDIQASNYVANEIAGTGCNPEGAKTISWLYIEKPCRIELKTTRAENVSPDDEGALEDVADILEKVSEEGTKLGGRLAKTFSITKSFAIWICVVRDWESYKAEYVCRNGVWQHGTMTLANSGVKQISGWEKLTDESGQSAWTKDDDMTWILNKANALKDKYCK